MSYFSKIENRCWGLLKTQSNAEKSVRKYLEGNGYPCYLPLICNTNENLKNKHSKMMPMFPGYIFAAWGTIEDKDKIHRHSLIAYYTFHDYAQEDFVIESMEQIKRIELASKEYAIKACSAPSSKNWTTIKDGTLSGCGGYLSRGEERSRFTIKLSLVDAFFEILIPNNVLSY